MCHVTSVLFQLRGEEESIKLFLNVLCVCLYTAKMGTSLFIRNTCTVLHKIQLKVRVNLDLLMYIVHKL